LITISPMARLGTSLHPDAISRCSMLSTMASMAPVGSGRFWAAERSPWSSFLALELLAASSFLNHHHHAALELLILV